MNKKIGKILSYALRHNPKKINVNLDNEGWTSTEEVINGLHNIGMPITQRELEEIVEDNDKKRFAFNTDKTRIRASQGHSVNVYLGYKNEKPPTVLYHGTAAKSVESIMKLGITKQSRIHVHLSGQPEEAITVGTRHGIPVLFQVMAEDMYNDKYDFFLSENGVWLTEDVPAKYLKIIKK